MEDSTLARKRNLAETSLAPDPTPKKRGRKANASGSSSIADNEMLTTDPWEKGTLQLRTAWDNQCRVLEEMKRLNDELLREVADAEKDNGELRRDKDNLEKRNGEIEKRIQDLEKTATHMTTKIDRLTQDNTDLNKEVIGLNEEIDVLERDLKGSREDFKELSDWSGSLRETIYQVYSDQNRLLDKLRTPELGNPLLLDREMESIKAERAVQQEISEMGETMGMKINAYMRYAGLSVGRRVITMKQASVKQETELEKKVARLEQKIANLEKDKKDLADRVTYLQPQSSVFRQRVKDELKRQIDTCLEKAVNSANGRL